MKLYPDSMAGLHRSPVALHMRRPSYSRSGPSPLDDEREERFEDRMEVYYDRTAVFDDDVDPDVLAKRFERWEEKVDARFCAFVERERAAYMEEKRKRLNERHAEAARRTSSLVGDPGYAAIGIGVGACGLLMLGGAIAIALQSIGLIH